MVAITKPSSSGISSSSIEPPPTDPAPDKSFSSRAKKPLSIYSKLPVNDSLYRSALTIHPGVDYDGHFWSKTPPAHRPSVNSEALALSKGHQIKKTRDDFFLNPPRHFSPKRSSVFEGECSDAPFASWVKKRHDQLVQSNSANNSSSAIAPPSKIHPPSDKKVDDDSEDESPSASSTAGDKEIKSDSKKDLFALSLEDFENGTWKSSEPDDMD